MVAKLAGAGQVRFLRDHQRNPIVDQELFRNLPAALEDLRQIINETRPDVLLTLAYEGGHPDHDCCSFLASIMSEEFHLPAWEMPLYHRTPAGELSRQQFPVPGSTEFVYNLSPAEQLKKRTMIDVYRSQQAVLKDFTVAAERFRLLRQYDYSSTPHPGVLNYEAWGWPMSGSEVTAALRQCSEQLQAERTGTRP
jgi:LmbE family N-acetylglucosaminyl deacetylase